MRSISTTISTISTTIFITTYTTKMGINTTNHIPKQAFKGLYPVLAILMLIITKSICNAGACRLVKGFGKQSLRPMCTGTSSPACNSPAWQP